VRSFNDEAIVLRRVEYGEADRVITFLTAENGQVSAIAKGVRRPKSKLAGGLELLSISKVTFIETKGNLKLVRSARMEKHFGEIVKDYDRLQFAYAAIKAIHTMTEDVSEDGAFNLLLHTMQALNKPAVSLEVVEVWFYLQALRSNGQQPNLETDTQGAQLEETGQYRFDGSQAAFAAQKDGPYRADHIKAIRLLLKTEPAVTTQVKGLAERCDEVVGDLRHLFERVLALGA